jgi:hypothetical protein
MSYLLNSSTEMSLYIVQEIHLPLLGGYPELPIPDGPTKKGPSNRSLRPCLSWLLDLGSNQGPTD